jgi:beta-glucosidase
MVPLEVVGCARHVALAREASRKAIVLLKNERVPGRNAPSPLLPLDRNKLDSIAVIGSHANRVFLGAYSGDPVLPAVTTYAGITNLVGERVMVRHVPHVDLDERRRRLKKDEKLDPKVLDEEKRAVATALDAAARADVAVVVLGLNSRIESEGRDRSDMNLPKDQQEFVEKVVALNPATVVVLINGSPLTIGWLQEHVPAIVEAWYPGEQGGHAIAEVLFGDYNPAGRLPITFYASLQQLPDLFDYEISHGRTYMHLRTPPLYPFGHGLSYTCFEYRDLRLAQSTLGTNETLTVTVDIANSGDRDGEEVAQLYVRELDAAWPAPLRQLRGFQRVPIAAGETRPVTFALRMADLGRWDASRQGFVVRPGHYEIEVGASSADIRATARFRIESE